jgi:hypothetical protein
VRGALAMCRRLPKRASISCKAASVFSNRWLVWTIATPLRYGGSFGSGQAAERHQRERARMRSPAGSNAAKAASSKALVVPYEPARFDPRATMIA